MRCLKEQTRIYLEYSVEFQCSSELLSTFEVIWNMKLENVNENPQKMCPMFWKILLLRLDFKVKLVHYQ